MIFQMKNLALVEFDQSQKRGRCGIEANNLVFEVASMQSLGDEKIYTSVEDIEIIADSPYISLLKKYSGLLQHKFSDEFTKNGITLCLKIK